MRVDECEHSFDHLAAHVLPNYMRELKNAMKSPWPASAFSLARVGPRGIARSLGLEADFGGCYVLLDREKAIYVGISRRVISRIRQHVVGRSHFDASLAYLIAHRRLSSTGQRSHNMRNPEFRARFAAAQQYLRTLEIAAVRVDNALVLHVFEVYAAMALGTSEWNSFRTH
jgi:hypothetical protein